MTISVYWPDKLKKVRWESMTTFFQRMSNRLAQGQFRYGPPDPGQKYLTRMKLEIKAYQKSGNAEHLYNIANYCWLENEAPENKKFHFDNSVDSVTRGKI